MARPPPISGISDEDCFLETYVVDEEGTGDVIVTWCDGGELEVGF